MEETKEEISQSEAYGEVTQCKQTARGAKEAGNIQIDEVQKSTCSITFW